MQLNLPTLEFTLNMSPLVLSVSSQPSKSLAFTYLSGLFMKSPELFGQSLSGTSSSSFQSFQVKFVLSSTFYLTNNFPTFIFPSQDSLLVQNHDVQSEIDHSAHHVAPAVWAAYPVHPILCCSIPISL